MSSTDVLPSRVSYAPHPHFLLSKMRENLPWWKALGELIDNAFDHNATRVAITCSARAVEVVDDGTGIKSLVAALSLGNHQPSDATALGMYGVGLKDAWLSVGDSIEITSIYKGLESSVSLNVKDFAPPDWNAPAPTTRDAVTGSGTIIKLHLRPRKHQPGKEAWSTLSWIFTPALKQGKQIVRRVGKKKQPLAPLDLPPVNERIACEFDVRGKHVSIDIGITAEGYHIEHGPFWIQYGHRIITASSIGAKNYSTDRLAGVIVLGKGWALTKNKDDLADFADELNEAVEQRIKPLLEKAQTLSEQIELSALNLEIEGALNEAFSAAKKEARNQTGESPGAQIPTDSGRRRRRAAKVSEAPGSVEASKPTRKRGIQFGWNRLADGIIGEYDSLAKRVNLNSAHPYAAALRAQGNKPALQILAIAVLSYYESTHKDGNLTCFEIIDFNQCFGHLLKQMKVEHGEAK